ncbi:MAG TPA: hypothetical protein VGS58_02115, partial [Candidatus Sulfopaludibacter sp.]|nr:hypothetical protein [Candidatus Sulfopaludibacter sp.]
MKDAPTPVPAAGRWGGPSPFAACLPCRTRLADGQKRPSVLLLAFAAAAFAQQTPHAGYVYPAGGRQDSTFEVTVGGQFLNGAGGAYFSGGGVRASVKRYIRPLTPGQANMLREQMQELNKKRSAGTALTPGEQGTLAEIREKLMEFQRRPASPAIAETVVLQVTVARDATPDVRELRIDTALGLTNPIAFRIGQLQEFTRPVAKVPPAFQVVNGATPPPRVTMQAPEAPMNVTLPAVLNGQMMPGTTDRYRFTATRGQHIVIAAAARELMPYISDAVPGWFQAAIVLRDPAGREVASADHFRFHPDPVLDYEIPADGGYQIEIHDSNFRGREDF